MSRKPVCALDIGHGNNVWPPSKGLYKNGKGYAEHDFNSKLVQAIDPLLRANGIKTIIYQKPNKKDKPLIKRTNYYNRKKVDLVYSIHANANSDPNANGRCAFYWHTAKDSKRLAEIIVDEIKKSGYSTHGNGLHASMPDSWTNLHICRETNMPAVLVENGFMTGDEDFNLVFGDKQADYIKDMAQVHAKAICRYFGIDYKGKYIRPSPSKPKPAKKTNKPTPKTGSIVDYLNSKNINSSFPNRKKLAAKNGISNYKGTASQNIALLNKLQSGPASKPKTSLPGGILRHGSRGNSVKILQRALNAANFKVGKVDGIFGKKTKDAVERVQKVHDPYNVDGIFGPRTKEILDKLT